MKAIFRRDDPSDDFESTVENAVTSLRVGDVVVRRQRYHVIEHAQYDLNEDAMTYWLGRGEDRHPTAPESSI